MASTRKLADLDYPLALEETTQLLKDFPVDQRPRGCSPATPEPVLKQTASRRLSTAVLPPRPLQGSAITSPPGKTDSAMNRAPRNGGLPPQAPSGGGISLKKATVRVARPSTPSRPSASRMFSEPSRSAGNVNSLEVTDPARVPIAPAGIPGDEATPPATAPVVGESLAEDGPAPSITAATILTAPFSGKDNAASKDPELDLEAQFALLVSQSASRVASPSTVPSVSTITATKQPVTKTNDNGNNTKVRTPHRTEVQGQQPTAKVEPPVSKNDDRVSSSSVSLMVDKIAAATISGTKVAVPEETLSQDSDVDETVQEIVKLEQQCVEKALRYLLSLTGDVGPTCELLKTVATKLQRAYSSFIPLKPGEPEKLRIRYIDAIAAFIEKNNCGGQDITKSVIGAVLANTNGNFMALCTLLALQHVLSLENLDQMIALSKAINDVLIQVQDSAIPPPTTPEAMNHKPINPCVLRPAPTPRSATPPSTTAKDPLEGAVSWPVREKRENSPECRTCILTGLPEQVSINEVQALVFGGRLESIKLSKTGSQKAHVRFLEPEACRKYFDATQNGIKMPGHKAIILVEKTSGPNSVNDVVQNCADGNATRCVRAYDADDHWGTMQLLTFARGTGTNKRETDTVCQGRNSKGRKWVEFRFANIFDALQFKRILQQDEDWEHCTIGFAPDQCEIAQGVHFQNVSVERESGTSFS